MCRTTPACGALFGACLHASRSPSLGRVRSDAANAMIAITTTSQSAKYSNLTQPNRSGSRNLLLLLLLLMLGGMIFGGLELSGCRKLEAGNG